MLGPRQYQNKSSTMAQGPRVGTAPLGRDGGWPKPWEVWQLIGIPCHLIKGLQHNTWFSLECRPGESRRAAKPLPGKRPITAEHVSDLPRFADACGPRAGNPCSPFTIERRSAVSAQGLAKMPDHDAAGAKLIGLAHGLFRSNRWRPGC